MVAAMRPQSRQGAMQGMAHSERWTQSNGSMAGESSPPYAYTDRTSQSGSSRLEQAFQRRPRTATNGSQDRGPNPRGIKPRTTSSAAFDRPIDSRLDHYVVNGGPDDGGAAAAAGTGRGVDDNDDDGRVSAQARTLGISRDVVGNTLAGSNGFVGGGSGVGRPFARSHSYEDASATGADGIEPTTGLATDHWIHRDKLTMIEIQEYRERGMDVPRELLQRARTRRRQSQSQSQSRSRSRRATQTGHAATGGSDDGAGSGTGSGAGSSMRKRHKTGRLPHQPDAATAAELEDDEEAELRRQYEHGKAMQRYDADESVFVPEDPRTPEEIASEMAGQADTGNGEGDDVYGASHHLRSSSSRIPLSKSSPLPVPQEHVARTVPLPRKRGASATLDEDSLVFPGSMRGRSTSVGSRVLLDDDLENGAGPESLPNSPSRKQQPQPSSGANGGSPSKVRAVTLGKPSPSPSSALFGTTPPSSSGIRKVSAPAPRSTSISVPKTRTASTTAATATSPSSIPRPTTRDGRAALAANGGAGGQRPEGDPPWLATMYAPDPHLPPDQQMLPTHAKRMMQEQWQREGKVARSFDRDFTPISVARDAELEEEEARRARRRSVAGLGNGIGVAGGQDSEQGKEEEGFNEKRGQHRDDDRGDRHYSNSPNTYTGNVHEIRDEKAQGVIDDDDDDQAARASPPPPRPTAVVDNSRHNSRRYLNGRRSPPPVEAARYSTMPRVQPASRPLTAATQNGDGAGGNNNNGMLSGDLRQFDIGGQSQNGDAGLGGGVHDGDDRGVVRMRTPPVGDEEEAGLRRGQGVGNEKAERGCCGGCVVM